MLCCIDKFAILLRAVVALWFSSALVRFSKQIRIVAGRAFLALDRASRLGKGVYSETARQRAGLLGLLQHLHYVGVVAAQVDYGSNYFVHVGGDNPLLRRLAGTEAADGELRAVQPVHHDSRSGIE